MGIGKTVLDKLKECCLTCDQFEFEEEVQEHCSCGDDYKIKCAHMDVCYKYRGCKEESKNKDVSKCCETCAHWNKYWKGIYSGYKCSIGISVCDLHLIWIDENGSCDKWKLKSE